MNRRRYPGIRGRVNTLAAVLGGLIFSLWGAGIYVERVYGIAWASRAAGILGVVVFGLVGILWTRSIFKRAACPECGCVPLRRAEDKGRKVLLICDSCAIEWHTGVYSARD